MDDLLACGELSTTEGHVSVDSCDDLAYEGRSEKLGVSHRTKCCMHEGC